MNSISTFTFQENHNVRVQMIDCEPWFCLRDVCNVLDLNTRSSKSFGLDDKGVQNFYTPSNGGNQQLNYVNEPNLYRVIFRSNKPEAKYFQDWVFNEVLPTIRTTGKYEIVQPVQLPDPVKTTPTATTFDLNDPAFLRRALMSYTEKVITLEEKVEVMQVSVDSLDCIADMDGLLLMSDVAKLLKQKPQSLIEEMSKMKWIFRRSTKSPWKAAQQMILLGILEHKIEIIDRGNGECILSQQVLVTAKGLRKLANIYSSRQRNRALNNNPYFSLLNF